VMRAPRGRGVVTPDLAQQAGALPYCQRQHDRKENGSKHRDPRHPQGQELRQPEGAGDLNNPHVFSDLAAAGQRETCGISPVSAENPAGRADWVQLSVARVIAFLVAPKLLKQTGV
jgi:hypothetical protein